jgi:chromosome segregation ATPase
VQSLSQSIKLKEKLVDELQKSQKQYDAMKLFYERKLDNLGKEMEVKQAEKDKLLEELRALTITNQSAVNSEEEPSAAALSVREAKESKLKELVRQKDDELKQLRKKQLELNHLSQIQSRYLEQLSKLETEIASMKRQRVELNR